MLHVKHFYIFRETNLNFGGNYWHQFTMLIYVAFLPSKCRVARRSPKCIRKKLGRWIQKNLRNVNWYSCYELSKTGKFHTFLVSFMVLLSCPEWSRSCFAMLCKIFPNITHKPVLREVQHNTTLFFFFFSKYALKHLLSKESCLCPGLTFNIIRQIKEVQSSNGFLFKLSYV